MVDIQVIYYWGLEDQMSLEPNFLLEPLLEESYTRLFFFPC